MISSDRTSAALSLTRLLHSSVRQPSMPAVGLSGAVDPPAVRVLAYEDMAAGTAVLRRGVGPVQVDQVGAGHDAPAAGLIICP